MKLTKYRFLWVSLQIESLCDSRRIKIEGDLVDELARLPRSLAGMYSLTLENISQIEERGRTLAEAVLRWLLCTEDAGINVTIEACFKTTSAGRKELFIADILDVCSTLVVYDEVSYTFRFAHLSVREFLESQPGYTLSEANMTFAERSLQLLVSPSTLRALRISEACKRALHIFEARKPALWRFKARERALRHLEARNNLKIQPEDLKRRLEDLRRELWIPETFLFYAMDYWVSHYNRLEEQHRRRVFELYAKHFLFDGGASGEAFNGRTAEAFRLWIMLRHQRISDKCIRDGRSFDPLLEDMLDEATIKSIRRPADLASCFGWLEILEFSKRSQGLDAFRKRGTKLMRIAILCDQTSEVRWLFAQNICPTDEQLELAFRLRRSEMVQYFLNMNVLSPNALANGQNILALAVRFDLRDLYWHLIRKGASMHFRDEHGRTLLHLAVWHAFDDPEFIEYLLQAGLDPGLQDSKGKTPFSLSISGNRQCFPYSTRYVLSKDLEGLLQSSRYHTACLLLHYRLDAMLENVEMRAEWVNILTFIATRNPRLQRHISTLVGKRSRRAVNNQLDHTLPEDRMLLVGQTLLSLAALLRQEDAFRALIDAGIDPACPDLCAIGQRASTSAQRDNRPGEHPPLDIDCDSNSNCIIDELRQGPLAWAACTGDLPLVQTILDGGLNANTKNRKGQTALFFAVQGVEDGFSREDSETCRESVVWLLLQRGAIVTSADAYAGSSLLAHALKAGYARLVRVLLENGAELPASDTDGGVESLRRAFDQGQEGIPGVLLAGTGGGGLNSLSAQPSLGGFQGSRDSLDVATRLIHGGVMRLLGDGLKSSS